jgi:hypothetical protein
MCISLLSERFLEILILCKSRIQLSAISKNKKLIAGGLQRG